MVVGVVQKGALSAAALGALLGAHHVSLADAAIVAGIVIYILTVARDRKPARALRADLVEVRAELAERDKKYAELERKHAELERKYEQLSQGRDFSVAFAPLERAIDQARADSSHEHEKILTALEVLTQGVTGGFADVSKNLSANTAAISTLAAGIYAGTTVPPPAPAA